MLDTRAANFENYYGYAREVINSLQFLEGAAMRYTPTEQADSIGITRTNFPRIDGSTSTIPLTQEIIRVMFAPDGTLPSHDHRFYEPQHASRTVPSYELLIANYLDMILVPDPSDYVLNLAEEAGVELEFFPVAVEALVFITSIQNPVSDITTEQILQIYTDRSITNWAELNGDYGRIIPLNRNPHSGSQTLMDNLVLEGRTLHPALMPYAQDMMGHMISSTANPMWWVLGYRNDADDPYEIPMHGNYALGYTVYFLLRALDMWYDEMVKPLSLNGVFPSRETIMSGEYSLTTNYFAVIRADTPQNHPARKLVNWLLTQEGQDAVEAARLGRIW